jgi:hypothetical protein
LPGGTIAVNSVDSDTGTLNDMTSELKTTSSAMKSLDNGDVLNEMSTEFRTRGVSMKTLQMERETVEHTAEFISQATEVSSQTAELSSPATEFGSQSTAVSSHVTSDAATEFSLIHTRESLHSSTNVFQTEYVNTGRGASDSVDSNDTLSDTFATTGLPYKETLARDFSFEGTSTAGYSYEETSPSRLSMGETSNSGDSFKESYSANATSVIQDVNDFTVGQKSQENHQQHTTMSSLPNKNQETTLDFQQNKQHTTVNFHETLLNTTFTNTTSIPSSSSSSSLSSTPSLSLFMCGQHNCTHYNGTDVIGYAHDVMVEPYDVADDDTAVMAVKAVTLVVLAAVGVVGNALVIWSMVKQSHLHRPPFYYLLSLSLTDLSRAAFCLPLVLMTLLQGQNQHCCRDHSYRNSHHHY